VEDERRCTHAALWWCDKGSVEDERRWSAPWYVLSAPPAAIVVWPAAPPLRAAIVATSASAAACPNLTWCGKVDGRGDASSELASLNLHRLRRGDGTGSLPALTSLSMPAGGPVAAALAPPRDLPGDAAAMTRMTGMTGR
jgi:hypothetical protein